MQKKGISRPNRRKRQLTIGLSPEVEGLARADARKRGLPLNQWVELRLKGGSDSDDRVVSQIAAELKEVVAVSTRAASVLELLRIAFLEGRAVSGQLLCDVNH